MFILYLLNRFFFLSYMLWKRNRCGQLLFCFFILSFCSPPFPQPCLPLLGAECRGSQGAETFSLGRYFMSWCAMKVNASNPRIYLCCSTEIKKCPSMVPMGMINSVTLEPCVQGVCGWFVPTCQHCLLITVRLMQLGLLRPPQISVTGTGPVVKIHLPAHKSIRSSLAPGCAVNTSVVPALREQVPPATAFSGGRQLKLAPALSCPLAVMQPLAEMCVLALMLMLCLILFLK